MKIIKTEIVDDYLFPEYIDFAVNNNGKMYMRKLERKLINDNELSYDYTDWIDYSYDNYIKLKERKPLKKEEKNE